VRDPALVVAVVVVVPRELSLVLTLTTPRFMAHASHRKLPQPPEGSEFPEQQQKDAAPAN
jgi:hypothetical protein